MTIRRLGNRLRGACREEDGNITAIATVTIVLSMLIVLPMVWNWGALYTTRTFSQNGSDAGSLAAAETVARQLNNASLDWWGCIPPETPPSIVQKYVGMVVMPIGNGGAGAGAAQDYAAANRSDVRNYAQFVQPMGPDGIHAKIVDGVTIPPTRVELESAAPVTGILAEGIYRLNGTPVGSYATAETYLYNYRTWETPCPLDPEAIARHYQFTWRVRLIDDRRD